MDEKQNSYFIYFLILFIQKCYMVWDQDPTLFIHSTSIG